MNPATAAAIQEFRTNSYPETVEALRASVASNYDGVVVRKADKRDELQAETDALRVQLDEMIASNAPQYQINRQQTLINERRAVPERMPGHVGQRLGMACDAPHERPDEDQGRRVQLEAHRVPYRGAYRIAQVTRWSSKCHDPRRPRGQMILTLLASALEGPVFHELTRSLFPCDFGHSS